MKLQFEPDWPVRCDFNFVVELFHANLFHNYAEATDLVSRSVAGPA